MKYKILIILFFCTSLNAKMITPEELGVVFNSAFERKPSYINTGNIIQLFTKETGCKLVIDMYMLGIHSTKPCEEVAKIINK